MVFTRDASSMPGTIKSPPIRVATARDGPIGGGGGVEANHHSARQRREASRGGIEVSHNDAPKRDMTHQAPTSPVRSPSVDAKNNTLESEGKCLPSTESHTSVPVNLT